jgi:hypothetical protein
MFTPRSRPLHPLFTPGHTFCSHPRAPNATGHCEACRILTRGYIRATPHHPVHTVSMPCSHQESDFSPEGSAGRHSLRFLQDSYILHVHSHTPFTPCRIPYPAYIPNNLPVHPGFPPCRAAPQTAFFSHLFMLTSCPHPPQNGMLTPFCSHWIPSSLFKLNHCLNSVFGNETLSEVVPVAHPVHTAFTLLSHRTIHILLTLCSHPFQLLHCLNSVFGHETLSKVKALVAIAPPLAGSPQARTPKIVYLRLVHIA